MRNLVLALLLLLGFGVPKVMAEVSKRKRPLIMFIAPSSPSNTYWPSVYRVIESVGRDLDFDFTHIDYGVKDRFLLSDLALKIIESDDRPDALIISVAIGNAKPILEAADRYRVPVIFQGPLFPFELKKVGEAPRLKYKFWIANLDQDEVLKGYMSAKLLFTKAMEARNFAKDGKIHLLAIGGQRRWIGSLQRDAGMQKALKEFPLIELKQLVPSDWSTEGAEIMTSKLLNRFPEASIIWSASDAMAEGAVRALEKKGLSIRDGKHFVSGIDMSEFGLNNVIAGRTVGTAAMSVLGMGEMVVYVYDYLKGRDFATEIGTSIAPQTLLATPENAPLLLDLFKKVDRIDFRRFSRTYNPELKRYNFTFETLLDAAGISRAHH